MTFAELVTLTRFILSSNDGQTDQDVSDNRIKEFINLRYREEVNRAKQEGSRRWFRKTQDVTWPADQVTLSAPEDLIASELIEIRDITDDGIGETLTFSEDGTAGDVFWKDHETLQWGEDGPSDARTLRFVFYARAVPMAADDDVPVLLPPEHRSLLAWSTAVELRDILDETAPARWIQRLEDLRLDLYKFISKGRPTRDEGSSQVRGVEWDIGSTPQDGSSIS